MDLTVLEIPPPEKELYFINSNFIFLKAFQDYEFPLCSLQGWHFKKCIGTIVHIEMSDVQDAKRLLLSIFRLSLVFKKCIWI